MAKRILKSIVENSPELAGFKQFTYYLQDTTTGVLSTAVTQVDDRDIGDTNEIKAALCLVDPAVEICP